ncbi:CKLF-like MARVEL transmembrane domain-containing protein 8 [Geospiza fortis]|uniref:CKLF-like MARVEL transmembrane domain-containing protein 8 n=1 Tax=Geospiza fortis TaxID=48883 RepID=A0A8N5EPE5_GEOFO|nr:CKLF-like MARVEL transmembrane domain-containing protein 8 [Geospiza fortis]
MQLSAFRIRVRIPVDVAVIKLCPELLLDTRSTMNVCERLLVFVPSLVLGLLVWTLIAGTEYFLYPAFGWVMFVAVFYWVLTVFFLIIYMTMTYTRIPQVPWTMVGLCFNGSAFVLYLIAAIVDASSVTKDLDNHNYNSWAASSFFAFVVTSCYAGNTYFSFISWRSRTLQ